MTHGWIAPKELGLCMSLPPTSPHFLGPQHHTKVLNAQFKT